MPASLGCHEQAGLLQKRTIPMFVFTIRRKMKLVHDLKKNRRTRRYYCANSLPAETRPQRLSSFGVRFYETTCNALAIASELKTIREMITTN
jgi:hypothetical protein